MNTAIRIDTVKLRSHLDIIDSERRYALELLEHLQYVLVLSDGETRTQVVSAIQKVEYILRHCKSMSEAINETCSSFEIVSQQISDVLNDYAALNRTD